MPDTGVIISVLSVSTGIVLSVWIVLEKRRPTSTLAWILVLIALPWLGLLFYLVFGRRRLKRRAAIRTQSRAAVRAEIPLDENTVHAHLSDQIVVSSFETQNQLISLATRNAEAPVTVGNSVQILCNAEETYPELFAAIAAAKEFVHVEYYIVQPDSAGARLRDLLQQKAELGVSVRFLFDGVGSIGIDDTWLDPLLNAGAECEVFLPLRLPRVPSRPRWNFRNHRKLVVVDGEVGFTGGLNIGEEYEGKTKRLGFWRDTHLKIVGPAVRSLERIFHEDWYYATNKLITGREYFPAPGKAGDDLVQIIPSGPDREWESIHLQMFQAIATARNRCFITTPYFVPDEAIRVALVAAALRGVNVRLLVPSKSDLRLVLWAGRSYYGELLRAGVRIFEYQKGFLHAKTLVVDGNFATVGSANMDIRSFRLNFELNAFVYSPRFSAQAEAIFEKDLEDATELTLEQYVGSSLGYRLAAAYARLMSPLL
ncbi:MAG: cardiolipin synthase [Deltaproteobacteria bacterium CG2_30_63_29]|nr:MAG: cardiolipin synthase [Deltaproteobacteria bacterium CG2_30_63_29]PJB34048.1 MAG: cardiolipin synthase [Deltaproteobacteria bacterium CG_4_9_14_3_um_filter_63_12]